ncbi:MAG TPA: hypothetical protein VHX44_05480 [Planctomycetota bacterium]|jgi:hypothetical protein|nr:hypothetical protein [Planctomycetota bacterium]
MSEVLQIVPRLPPVVDGLGDYAVLLAESLAGCGITSRFLVSDRTRASTESGPPALVLTDHSAAGIELALAGHRDVLLHFVNYAYEPTRGCPWWLLDGLARWRQAHRECRLVVMFHELYAMAWPWRKAFWYSAPQRAISAELARLADACWTSNQRYARWLERILGRTVPVTPVLSNMGEPTAITPWAEREPALVVFGRAVNRQRAYHALRQELVLLGRLHGLTTIHDVGAPLAHPVRLPGFTITHHGLLPTAELSPLLQRCRAGIIHNDGSPLAKSGVAAAYAAHGVAIACEAGQGGEDGLVPGHNLLVLDGDLNTPLERIATQGHRWYQQHDRLHLAALIVPWFRSPVAVN